MSEKLKGIYLNGSLNMEDKQGVNGCHCERSVAISYGKMSLRSFMRFLRFAWNRLGNLIMVSLRAKRGNLIKRNLSLIFLRDCHTPFGRSQ
jgi:hypothetical protein